MNDATKEILHFELVQVCNHKHIFINELMDELSRQI